MYIEIITPEKKLYEGEIKSVVFPGSEGSFGILRNHAPLISTLGKGVIKLIDKKESTQLFKINGGVVETMNNKISVLAETA